jgi:hypothetical protein
MFEKSGSANLKSDLRITGEKRHSLPELPKILLLESKY